ncbi:HD-GYP domain-containing protein [Cohnella rhizosphaerae]|uniref:HD-GYP domain-containing protein n=1 Tax=Cohnella rhizosphaerae TaxID=1457232 RepID=A0A9X4KUT9_9BACL|nr:HD-GYP domain-containing protein [Cohnella rhizosphaerae]MDG0811470.1 HD-GYP domain-containing protein [Cohnella rhizosphaerae]
MNARSLLGPLAASILPYAAFVILSRNPAWDGLFVLPGAHFYIVSSVALLALVVALFVAVAGRRVRNIKVSFLALSFISLSVLFMVHGLSTPNLLLGVTALPKISAPLSVIFATVWLWLSSWRSDHPFIRFLSCRERYLLPLWTALLSLAGLIGLLHPDIVGFIRLDVHPLNSSATLFVIAVNIVTGYRYYRSYLYSRFPLELAIVYAAAWLIAAQLIMTQGDVWRGSWWLYHFLLLAAMLVVLAGLYRQYASKRSLAGAIKGLFTTDPVERITNALQPSVRALMLATESKDPYTAGHNFRVTLYALKIAEQLQLGPEQLRALVGGTIVHDVGKIETPDAVLNKPGRLTSEERAIIEEHPVRGYEMCRNLGFMEDELGIIRSHHEKWNGEGYPDRLAGEEIPRMARIVAVADVYDALTSNRAYRRAMSHDDAMAILNASKGTHFEPACVEAWERACQADPEMTREGSALWERGLGRSALA